MPQQPTGTRQGSLRSSGRQSRCGIESERHGAQEPWGEGGGGATSMGRTSSGGLDDLGHVLRCEAVAPANPCVGDPSAASLSLTHHSEQRSASATSATERRYRRSGTGQGPWNRGHLRLLDAKGTVRVRHYEWCAALSVRNTTLQHISSGAPMRAGCRECRRAGEARAPTCDVAHEDISGVKEGLALLSGGRTPLCPTPRGRRSRRRRWTQQHTHTHEQNRAGDGSTVT